MRKLSLAMMALVVLTCMAQAQGPAGAGSCESLAELKITGAKVLSAQTVAAGSFTPPPNRSANPAFYKTLPAFCRLSVEATPSADSSIKIEVWMPLNGPMQGGQKQSDWNGTLHGGGNGGFAGEIGYMQLGGAVANGSVGVGTDTGHAAGGTDASWALGHPEKVADFGYRGIHEMTRVAKAAIQAYYGKAPVHSYFSGCSNGGRQALMEAQRYPDDYDGILAGAPANFWTHLLTKALYDSQVTTLDPASYIPPAKLPAIAHAVNTACDAQDGVTDGILNDPRQCHFDPASMRCKEGDSEKCLTSPQVTALKKLYAGPDDAKGHKIFPGDLPGAEEGPGGWEEWITGREPGKSLIFAFGVGFFSNMVYGKADWNYKVANVNAALRDAETKAPLLNATNPDLTPFKKHGGKLILYHGWDDAAISAINTVNYFNSVVGKMGEAGTAEFARLYMMPGVQHCAGGPGPDNIGQIGPRAKDAQHNAVLALEEWVEKGKAPSAIIASKFDPEAPGKGPSMTRPLCPYPQTAKYKGSGDTNDAANFACAAGNK